MGGCRPDSLPHCALCSDIAVVSATGAVDISSYIFVCSRSGRRIQMRAPNPPQCLLAHLPAEWALSVPLLCADLRLEIKAHRVCRLFLDSFHFSCLSEKSAPAHLFITQEFAYSAVFIRLRSGALGSPTRKG